ncbi:hypothetical protein [Planobispora takensis]|uniref:Uncharacterized protein n=1 Tax=Planobispora takensis TaxID=1367882 RepID=A0A8J3WPZ4_9ACTN|nr:hypothetical protein [Planobispora takensis]GIH98554.1 hypothetical protein Pta02_05630 [Planobispora takensis]
MSHNFGPPSGGGYGAPQQPHGQQYGNQPYGGPQYGQQQQYGQQAGVPSYGYAPAGTAPQGPQGPQKVKPGIGWIVGAWIIAVLAIVGGVAGSAGSLFDTVTDAAPSSSVGPGEVLTVKVDPADASNRPAIYVSATQAVRYECAFQEGGPQGQLAQPGVQTTVTGTDGVPWELGLRVGAPQAGDYKIVCSLPEGGDARFGVGQELAAGQFAGGIVLLFVVPLAGFLLAVIVTIVVLVKRSRARKRLAAGAWGGPYGG